MPVRRTGGIHGVVKVHWQILPRDLATFVQIQGHVLFEDGQTAVEIELQVMQQLRADDDVISKL